MHTYISIYNLIKIEYWLKNIKYPINSDQLLKRVQRRLAEKYSSSYTLAFAF